MVNAPATLNGYPVVQSMTHANGVVTVMVQRPDNFEPFVVATWWNECKDKWFWGHYSRESHEADSDFAEAVKRNQNR